MQDTFARACTRPSARATIGYLVDKVVQCPKNADSSPKCSKLWDPIIPKISCTKKLRPIGIYFPRSDFIIVVYFIILDSYC